MNKLNAMKEQFMTLPLPLLIVAGAFVVFLLAILSGLFSKTKVVADQEASSAPAPVVIRDDEILFYSGGGDIKAINTSAIVVGSDGVVRELGPDGTVRVR